MTPFELISELHRRNVKVIVEGGDIRWKGPSHNGMTVELIRILKQHKPRLITILTGEDPRSDLTEDSHLWAWVLRSASNDAYDIDGVYGVLVGVRALGARLIEQNGHYRIDRGDVEEGEYASLRTQYLAPHTDAIRLLLNGLVTRTEAA